MRRLAGCLVVSLLASSAAWVGCHADLDEKIQELAAGSDGGVVLDTLPVLDTVVVTDGSGSGGVPDAGTTTGSDGGGEGGGSDDGGTTMGSDDGGTGGGDGGSGGGNPLQPGGNALDRTSFYACAGGPASAGLEVGLPIGLALVLAVRRRRRFSCRARSARPR